MKLTIFAAIIASAAAFAPSPVVNRPTFLAISKEEDIEMTREVIRQSIDGGEAPAAAPKKSKKKAAKEDAEE